MALYHSEKIGGGTITLGTCNFADDKTKTISLKDISDYSFILLVFTYAGQYTIENNWYNPPYYIPVAIIKDALKNASGKQLAGRLLNQYNTERFIDFVFKSTTSITVTSSIIWDNNGVFKVYGIY